MAAGELYMKSTSALLYWRNAANVERSVLGTLMGTSTTVGKVWVSGTYLYYQPPVGNTRRAGGALVTGGVTNPGRLYIDATWDQLRYVNGSFNLYRV